MQNHLSLQKIEGGEGETVNQEEIQMVPMMMMTTMNPHMEIILTNKDNQIIDLLMILIGEEEVEEILEAEEEEMVQMQMYLLQILSRKEVFPMGT